VEAPGKPLVESFELPLKAEGALPAKAGRGSLPESLLFCNIMWFCRLRWLVIALLSAFAAAGFFPGLLERFGLHRQVGWALAAAGVLAAANLGLTAHSKLLERSKSSYGIRLNLWLQIILDLLILTAVVHFVGSLETFIAFMYLFHIVLACIFFSGAQSFAVTVVACVLYIGCVWAEATGVISYGGLSMVPGPPCGLEQPAAALLRAASATAIWLVVWYLASHLSAMVRRRDYELAETNRRLVETQKEKTRHLLHTAHELKTPFASICANAQLLEKGYCGVVSDEAKKILSRISQRCRRMTAEIPEMLQLASLSALDGEAPRRTEVDLAEVLRECMSRLQPIAGERDVTLEEDLRPTVTTTVADHMRMLFGNILSNAVLYSHKGGRVRVTCRPAPAGGARAAIEDEGIGIAPEKLPHIFDDYYRTEEAVRHNEHSTGLGLSIVRHVARTHGIRIRVESAPGVGTSFVLEFPPSGVAPKGDTFSREG